MHTPEQPISPGVTTRYDAFGRLASNSITSAWDGFGRLTSSSTNMGGTTRTLSHLYDRNGNRFAITHPDGTWFGTNHDGLNRPNVLHQAGSARIYYGYNDRGARNGAYGTNGATDFWEYDGVQRLGAHGSFHPSTHASADVIRLFGYNPAGQIGSISRDNDAYAWTGAYNTARPYAANGLNQYARTGQPNSPGSVQFTYDANGNLASEAPWNGTAYTVSTTYTYDIENRLAAVSGSRTAALSYDPLGRLFEVSGATTTRFLYDGDALVAEYVSGAMTRRYVHNVGADVPMLSYQGSGLTQPSWLHADHQGSIVALSDAVGAATINTYDEYGIPGVGNSGRFQYTGQIWLDELGMYHYKARVYSPTLGRFLQTDPVGYDDQFNLYAYVGNDPVNRVDPTGRTCELLELSNGSAYRCKVDDRRGMSDRQYAKANAAYSYAVNRLMANPDRKVKIVVNNVIILVRGGDVARGLIQAHVRAGPNNPRANATTFGGALTPGQGTEDGRPIITLHQNGLREGELSRGAVDQRLVRTFVHEGIHTVPAEVAFFKQYRNQSTSHFNDRHIPEYRGASDELLE